MVAMPDLCPSFPLQWCGFWLFLYSKVQKCHTTSVTTSGRRKGSPESWCYSRAYIKLFSPVISEHQSQHAPNFFSRSLLWQRPAGHHRLERLSPLAVSCVQDTPGTWRSQEPSCTTSDNVDCHSSSSSARFAALHSCLPSEQHLSYHIIQAAGPACEQAKSPVMLPCPLLAGGSVTFRDKNGSFISPSLDFPHKVFS